MSAGAASLGGLEECHEESQSAGDPMQTGPAQSWKQTAVCSRPARLWPSTMQILAYVPCLRPKSSQKTLLSTHPRLKVTHHHLWTWISRGAQRLNVLSFSLHPHGPCRRLTFQQQPLLQTQIWSSLATLQVAPSAAHCAPASPSAPLFPTTPAHLLATLSGSCRPTGRQHAVVQQETREPRHQPRKTQKICRAPPWVQACGSQAFGDRAAACPSCLIQLVKPFV
mmetsp:Transcript_19523/g.47151  ORF Transcript_19523/g.47151 Transcript_19523/m.47151 type:complete len:224 (-) Transcript_19523:2615-3286(-)